MSASNADPNAYSDASSKTASPAAFNIVSDAASGTASEASSEATPIDIFYHSFSNYTVPNAASQIAHYS